MLKPLIAIFASGCLLAATTPSSSIGTVKSPGEFRVDGSTIRGNSSVFDGNLIETSAARSVVELSGAKITLSPQSSAKVFRDHTILESGTGVVKDAHKHFIEASTLRISPTSKDSVLQIEMSGPRHVAVMARLGSADVRNASGVLIASLQPGTALAFDPQAAASPATSMSGTVQAKAGMYVLTDSTTNVTAELRGADVAKYVGKKVCVTGSIIGDATAAGGASQVIQVTQIGACGGKKAAAAAAGAAGGVGAAGGAAAAGLATAATVAIVGGVAVAATVVGLATAGTFSGTSNASTP